MLVSDSDYEAGPVLVPDPDPTAPGAAEADTVGVPAGSAQPSGESDFVDGVENPGNSADLDEDATED
jgi:hypothetical protein